MIALPRWLRWIGVAVWAGLIFLLSSRPGSTLPPSDLAPLVHFVEFFVLGALLAWAMVGERVRRGALVALCVIAASLYAVSDELHQAFVPGRTPDVVDWGLDTLGALAGAALVAVLHARRARTGRR